MKKIISHIVAVVILISFIISCDFVKNANPPVEPNSGTGNVTPGIVYRKVLIEDYTGHKCGYCPPAGDTLAYLEKKYTGKIIPLAIHAGQFANINLTYPTDFRTTVGNAYDTEFGNSMAGNPNGLINRIGFGTGSFIKSYTSWEGYLVPIITEVAKFEIKIANSFNTGTNNLNTTITIKSLASNTGTYKLVVLLTQDSIIAEQLDYRLPVGSQTITNYEFNHVLRGAINSTWGDAIFTTPANVNDSVVKSYTNYTVNSSYNASKCHVVAYVYDADLVSPTHYEVLQAEEEKVK